MKIRPVKKYRKPSFAKKLAAVAAALGVLTGCAKPEIRGKSPANIDDDENIVDLAGDVSVDTTAVSPQETEIPVALEGDVTAPVDGPDPYEDPYMVMFEPLNDALMERERSIEMIGMSFENEYGKMSFDYQLDNAPVYFTVVVNASNTQANLLKTDPEAEETSFGYIGKFMKDGEESVFVIIRYYDYNYTITAPAVAQELQDRGLI